MTSELLINLDYEQDMHAYYQNYSDLPGFVLLESSDKIQGRYDILSACPYERFVIKPDAQDVHAALSHLKDLIQHKPSTYDLPFQGGAIGYVSYDLGARLAGIQSNQQSTLADMPLLDFGLYDWAIIVDHQLQKTILYAGHESPSTQDLIPELMKRWQRSAVIRSHWAAEGHYHSLISKEDYMHAFNHIQSALQEGRSYQVNFTQPFHTSYSGDPWLFYQKIREKNPTPYAAFLRMEQADILSFSPERLLLHADGLLLTSPIKGTIRRSNDLVLDEALKQELLGSEKNRAENIMIVDLLRNDLAKSSKPGTVRVKSLCELQSYNAVHHLVSDIEAQPLAELHPLDLFMSCFPGGSITGAPKLEAMRIIDEEESYARGVYCGSIAYFSRHGRFDSNIAIRTITAKENIFHFAAGGGIVIDSDAEDEYSECFIKLRAITDYDV